MKLQQREAQIFVPDGSPEEEAVERVTHLGIGAHQDDLEFMATHGILQCFQEPEKWFGGVTCTDGAGSARTGPYARYSAAEMQQCRIEEQKQAATIGRYGFMAQLGYPSEAIKECAETDVVDDLEQILQAACPEIVYTHQPADKHATHIAVMARTVAAIRRLPKSERPQRLYGCEVWRGLDWLADSHKIPLDVSGHDNLVTALNGVFDSQIAGGKRYDLAVEGRKRANATFFDSHAVDGVEKAWYALDLSPLLEDDSLDLWDFINPLLQDFAADVQQLLNSHT